MSLLAAAAAGGSGSPPVEPDHYYTSATLNTIPTYEGSGLTVHPSVVDMGSVGWHGFRYWLADTPYASEDVTVENPSIFGSHDGVTWQVPAGLTNPIDPWPGEATGDLGNYNSDPELVYDPDNDQMVCYWREWRSAIGEEPKVEILHTASSPDGVTWTHLGAPFTFVGYLAASPTVVRVRADLWLMWTFSIATATRMLTAPSALGPWTYGPDVSWVNRTGGADWHGDVLMCSDGVMRGVYTPRGGCWPFTASPDGLTFDVGAEINVGARHYRPTITERPDGAFDMWWADDSAMRVYRRTFPAAAWPPPI